MFKIFKKKKVVKKSALQLYKEREREKYDREIVGLLEIYLPLIEPVNFSILYYNPIKKGDILILNNVEDVKKFCLKGDWILGAYEDLFDMILFNKKSDSQYFNKKIIDEELEYDDRAIYLTRYKRILESKEYKYFIRNEKLKKINESNIT